MIHLYASDGRLLLDALDDAEGARRRMSRECPCTDETDPGVCEQCDEHLRRADEYADLAGVIYDLLASYEPDDPAEERIGGRGQEVVQVKGDML